MTTCGGNHFGKEPLSDLGVLNNRLMTSPIACPDIWKGSKCVPVFPARIRHWGITSLRWWRSRRQFSRDLQRGCAFFVPEYMFACQVSFSNIPPATPVLSLCFISADAVSGLWSDTMWSRSILTDRCHWVTGDGDFFCLAHFSWSGAKHRVILFWVKVYKPGRGKQMIVPLSYHELDVLLHRNSDRCRWRCYISYKS